MMETGRARQTLRGRTLLPAFGAEVYTLQLASARIDWCDAEEARQSQARTSCRPCGPRPGILHSLRPLHAAARGATGAGHAPPPMAPRFSVRARAHLRL